MEEIIKEYVDKGFGYDQQWDEEDENEVVSYIRDHAEKAPVLYRGLSGIDPEDIEFIQGDHSFASMSSSLSDAENFGDVILVIDGLEGFHCDDGSETFIDEWLVEDRALYIDRIEEKNGVTFVYAE